MRVVIALSAILAILWLMLSGYWYDPLLLGLGVVSIAIVVGMSRRMRIIDTESVPVHIMGRFFAYLPWLVWQVVLSNINVAKVILSPRLPISPTLGSVACTQETDLGQAIYANSITLTPGTISMDVADQGILVHALERGGFTDLEGGDMDRRVTRIERGGKA